MYKRIVSVLVSIVLCSSFFSACAPAVGSTIEAPEVLLSEIKAEPMIQHGAGVQFEQIVDVRPTNTSQDSATYFTEPGDDALPTVETALRDALTQHGIAIDTNDALRLRGELRTWRTQYTAAMSGTIASEAALVVELVDASGRVVYTGTYEGNRSSEFPVVTVGDLQKSLGFAMSKAIEELLSDEKFIQNVSTTGLN